MSANVLQKLRVGASEIACRVDGPAGAPAVLLVHGILTDHRAWDAVAARLQGRFRVVRPDLRGHGAGSAPAGPYTMQELADDCAGLLDALALDRVHFVGSSLGGMIGQQVGARHGHRLLSLTLANTAAVQGAPASWDERVAVARKSGVAALADGTLQRWFTPGFAERAPQELARMRELLCGTSVEGFAGCAQAVRDLSQLQLLSTIAVPTLVVVGSEDKATPPEQGRQIADAIPGARLVTLPAAHQAAVEQPQAFCDAWLSFVDGLGS
ncbi:alpha/beta fold hydrolase [Caenimonas terrae]|uniref:Alpha/beta fold hydrolase n=1 Tax=Caenimonas terrae TaxID=696074 RepID=A0ABW0N6F6_9BURK